MGSEIDSETMIKIKELAEICKDCWTTHSKGIIWDTADKVNLISRKIFDKMLVVKMKTEIIEYAVLQLPKEIEKSRRFEIADYILDKKGKWYALKDFININARKYWRLKNEA